MSGTAAEGFNIELVESLVRLIKTLNSAFGVFAFVQSTSCIPLDPREHFVLGQSCRHCKVREMLCSYYRKNCYCDTSSAFICFCYQLFYCLAKVTTQVIHTQIHNNLPSTLAATQSILQLALADQTEGEKKQLYREGKIKTNTKTIDTIIF